MSVLTAGTTSKNQIKIKASQLELLATISLEQLQLANQSQQNNKTKKFKYLNLGAVKKPMR